MGIWFMSLVKCAAVVFALSTTVASASGAVKCPRLLMGDDGTVHTLSGGRVFQGAVDKNVEVKLVHGHFDMSEVQGSAGREAFNLVCVYGGTAETKTLEVPSGAAGCDVADAGSGTVAGCR